MVYNIIVWSWALFFHLMHPFHVSVTEVSFNDSNKHLEISIRIFSDDLENVIKQFEKSEFDIVNSLDDTTILNKLELYLKSNLILKENSETIPLNFLGAEADGDVVWCFMESGPVVTPKTIWAHNTLLLDLFDDQINLVHLIIGDITRSTKYYRDYNSGPIIVK